MKNAALIAAGESVERVVEKPPALVHSETQHEVDQVAEETGLLEEPPYECLTPSVHQRDDQFATCSISVPYFYEINNTIHLSKKNASAQTAVIEASGVVETERQVTTTYPPIVPPNRVTGNNRADMTICTISGMLKSKN